MRMSQGNLFVFFVIVQGYLYNEEREGYEERVWQTNVLPATVKLTAMGFRRGNDSVEVSLLMGNRSLLHQPARQASRHFRRKIFGNIVNCRRSGPIQS